ncbi:metal-dependent transcriptional regulator [Arthrobacter agilis]|jgi:DtxR family Mn-dependent transcriptional regulator|uniref:metal-dependent transcriptional regulator n=1 Tax=Arthrobacter agilis TaxID=37921 RepID=UPI00277F8BB4|nr:metal-dependent transcriptional regulator [Arthrobacter agilis]MDQ0735489.1 DtxR family Mn-dependent transcriptional regulator [Arthrobacter agilis]
MAGRRGAVLSIESTSVQDYVKAIYAFTEWQAEAVTATHLAERLSVANSSVTGMVAKLVDLGLADHRKYGPVSLTPSGRALALAMVRRHRLIETFLVTELGYGWDEVHDEAELLEHTVSDAFIERLDAKLGHPRRDPHGDPIPAADGSVRYPPAHRLDGVDDGHAGRLVRVSDGDPAVLRFLVRHGIGLDDELLLERHGAGSLLELRIGAVPGQGTRPAGAVAPDPVPSPARSLTVDAALARALWIETTTRHDGCTLHDPGRPAAG